MDPRRRAGLAAAVALVAGLLAGATIGYLAHPSATAPTPPATLSISAAGTLGQLFPEAAGELVNSTPGVSAPLAAQLYRGSIAAVEAATVPGQAFDVVASADYHLIPQLLEPGWAGWEVVFATTPLVLAYDPSVAAFSGVNSSNWAVRLTEPGVVLGVANASVDPAGYNAIFALELQGLLANGSLGAVYSHFYGGAPGGFAVPSPTTTRVELESQAALLLGAHAVSAFLIYRSYAVENHLAYVALGPSVDLGSTDAGHVAGYAAASTTILAPSGAGSEVVRGAPVAFAATVPSNAPDPGLGNLFIHLLASWKGGQLLAAAGFDPIAPAWADHPQAVPGPTGFDVVGWPSGLPAPVP